MDKVYKNKTFRRLRTLKVSDYPKFERQVIVSMSSYTAIPAKPGVYFFNDLRGILYLGETSDLRRRFLEHLKKEKNPKLSALSKNPWGKLTYSWIKKNNKREAEHFETKYLNMFEPICNELLNKKRRK